MYITYSHNTICGSRENKSYLSEERVAFHAGGVVLMPSGGEIHTNSIAAFSNVESGAVKDMVMEVHP